MTAPGRGLGIFFKEPIPGQVKTRLSPPLTLEEAAGLYRAFLSDTIRMVSETSGLDIVILFHADESGLFRPPAPPGWLHRPQSGGDLGNRMEGALGELMDRLPTGRAGACLIGSDAPLLDATVLHSAFEALDSGSDLVTSPTPDGGYGLIGISRRPPGGFLSGIPWSTKSVLTETEEAAHRSGWSTARVRPCQDIDTGPDLSDFLTKMKSVPTEWPENAAPETRRYLLELIQAGRLAGLRQ